VAIRSACAAKRDALVGFLRSTPSAPFQNLVVAFGQGLKEEGFVEGQNAVVNYRYADNQIDRLPAWWLI
jgi:putative tryptophan/tyrosine transport system substrate-binding protein